MIDPSNQRMSFPDSLLLVSSRSGDRYSGIFHVDLLVDTAPLANIVQEVVIVLTYSLDDIILAIVNTTAPDIIVKNRNPGK